MDFWTDLLSFMHRWSDLWIFLTAVGTIGLATATYAIIRQGRHQSEDAKQQHRDRFKPICVLMPYDGVDALNKRGELIEKIDPSPENPPFGAFAIKCTLYNVGAGPALNLRIKFRFPNRGGWATEPWELSPLGPGESRGDRNSPLLVPIRIQDRFNATDLSVAPGEAWEIWLEYEDVFRAPFCSVHRKSPVRREEGLIPDPEATGKFRYAPQPWVTFPKCEAS